MAEVLITKRTRWECQKCGECCKGIIPSKNKSLSAVKEGKLICKNLDENNLCESYNKRPFICKLYPFVIDIAKLKPDANGTSRPMNAFTLKNLRIHEECPGYGKGKRIYGNKNLQKKLSNLGYEFSIKLKESFEKNIDIQELL